MIAIEVLTAAKDKVAASRGRLIDWADHRWAVESARGKQPAGAGAWGMERDPRRDAASVMEPLWHVAANTAREQAPAVIQPCTTPRVYQDYLFAIDADDVIREVVPGAAVPFPLPVRHAGEARDSAFPSAFWDTVQEARGAAEPRCIQYRDTSSAVESCFQVWLAPAQAHELIGVVCDITAHSRAPHAPNTSEEAYQRMISELRTRANALQAERDMLLKLATSDCLTGVWTRQAIFMLLEKALASARRANRPVTIMMADIDGFKCINDRLGHPAGDEVLREVARRFCLSVRISDEVGRYGGEEFLFLLPDCGGQAAMSRAEQFRMAIGGEPIMVDGQPLPVTCSFGLYTVDGGNCNGDEAMRKADAALYSAKNSGRNRCIALCE